MTFDSYIRPCFAKWLSLTRISSLKLSSELHFVRPFKKVDELNLPSYEAKVNSIEPIIWFYQMKFSITFYAGVFKLLLIRINCTTLFNYSFRRYCISTSYYGLFTTIYAWSISYILNLFKLSPTTFIEMILSAILLILH